MRVFVVKAFGRFAKAENLEDEVLWRAVEDLAAGRGATDLGGGVWKLRIARSGGGKSGGYRTLIAFRSEARAVFLHGFGKNQMENVGDAFLKDLRKQSKLFLDFSDEQIVIVLEAAAWREIEEPPRE